MSGSCPVKEDREKAVSQIEQGEGSDCAFHEEGISLTKDAEVRTYKGFLMIRDRRKGKMNSQDGEDQSFHLWKQVKIKAKRNCKTLLTCLGHAKEVRHLLADNVTAFKSFRK